MYSTVNCFSFQFIVWTRACFLQKARSIVLFQENSGRSHRSEPSKANLLSMAVLVGQQPDKANHSTPQRLIYVGFAVGDPIYTMFTFHREPLLVDYILSSEMYFLTIYNLSILTLLHLSFCQPLH
jgi:hypothetical protein